MSKRKNQCEACPFGAIHQWKKALLDGVPKVFARGHKSAPEVEVEPERIKDLHVRVGELTVERNFLSKKLEPWSLS